ncbi:unnamed protein product [Diamesa hyperborea]
MKLFIVILLTCLSLVNAQNLNPCFGVRDETFFPHPRTPSKFLACFNGLLEEGSCPPGMEFSRIELHCDLNTSSKRPDKTNVCTGAADETILPHSSSQRKFIICVNGDVLESVCPDEFPIFNPNELYCDYDVKVTTRAPPASRSTAPTRSTTRPTPPTRSTASNTVPTRSTASKTPPTRSTASRTQPTRPTRPPPS